MTKPSLDNPFRFGQILHEAGSYCPRPEMEATVAATARASGRLVVGGPRRMGKSSLVVRGLQEAKEFYVHVDAIALSSADEFTRRFTEAYDRALVSHRSGVRGKTAGLLDGIKSAVKSLQLSLQLAHVGASVSVERPTPGGGLADVLKVIEKHSRSERVTIFIDEVQDIMTMKKEEADKVVGALRSQMQLQGHTAFIFSGSNAAAMTQLFEDPRGPFYGSAVPLRVGPIPPKQFLDWITTKFAEGGRTLPWEIGPLLFEVAGNKPNDVQRLCSALWDVSRSGEKLGVDHLKKALVTIMSSVGESAANLMREVRPSQRKALIALAHIGSNLSELTLRRLGFRGEGDFARQLAPFLERSTPVLETSENRIIFSNPFHRAWIASRSDLAVQVPESLRRAHFPAVLLTSAPPVTSNEDGYIPESHRQPMHRRRPRVRV